MRILVAMGLLMALAVPALAGDGHGCDYGTQECLDYMAAHYTSRGWCGIELDHNKETSVMTVTSIVPESPAEASGFMVGDTLLGFNGALFADADDEAMKAAKKGMTAGADVTYIVEREGAKKELKVSLAEVPEDVLAAWIGSHMMEHVQDVAQLND